jgi:Fur family transcriptional regulator, ferric uptake regulator
LSLLDDQRDWRARALTVLEEAGYSRGGAREAVIAFLSGKDCATSAQDIHAALRGGGPGVAMASVYRALETLRSLHLVQRLEIGQGEALYEPLRPGGEHHHHVVCESCDRILPFEDPAVERAISHLSRRVDFEVAGHDVVLRGRCPQCRADAQPRTTR